MGRFAAAVAALLASLFLQIGSACAQEAAGLLPRLEITVQYSYTSANPGNSSGAFNLNGGIASFSYHFCERFSAIGEFNVARFGGLPNGVSSTMYTYLLGPRYSFRKSGRFKPFAHALFGVGRLDAGTNIVNAGENSFAMALGGGVDLHFQSHFSLRLVQADYLLTRFDGAAGNSETQNNLRISAGIVFRFGNR